MIPPWARPHVVGAVGGVLVLAVVATFWAMVL